MKKKLLILTLLIVACFATTNAQDKVWDFGNDRTTWPETDGIGTSPKIVDNLGLYPIADKENFGKVNTSSATFSDGYTATHRFQLNGSGGVEDPVFFPKQRYLFFPVTSDCKVKVWFKTGSNGTARTVVVTNGNSLLGSETTNTGTNDDYAIVTVNSTGSGMVYIYGLESNNLYKVEVSPASAIGTTTLSVDAESLVTTNVKAAGERVFVYNVELETEINIFSLTGALVKQIKTSTNTDFSMKAGLWIARIKTDKGEKSIKLLTY